MRRRQYIALGGVSIGSVLVGCAEEEDDEEDVGGEEQDTSTPEDTDTPGDADDTPEDGDETPEDDEADEADEVEEKDLEEPEPQSFDGEGSSVEELSVETGMVVFEGEHEGESNFIVELVDGPERDKLVFNEIGTVEAVWGQGLEGGKWLMDIDADGSWQVEVIQPRIRAGDGEDLPVSADGEAAGDWFAVNVDGVAEVTASHGGEENFIVESYGRNGNRHRDTLVFNEVGAVEDESTTLQYDGTTWITVEADGDWSLEFE